MRVGISRGERWPTVCDSSQMRQAGRIDTAHYRVALYGTVVDDGPSAAGVGANEDFTDRVVPDTPIQVDRLFGCTTRINGAAHDGVDHP